MASKPSAGVRISHLVLNVRDIDASHRFYTEVLGYEQCGELTHTLTMRFYRSTPEHHHDLALVQDDNPPPSPAQPWSLIGTATGINHIAMAFPDRDSWLAQLGYMKSYGVEFLVRGNHGMTHSAYIQDPDGNGIEVLYDLPAEVWEADVDAALNYFEFMPLDGEAALQDSTDYQRFGADATVPEGVEGRVVVRAD